MKKLLSLVISFMLVIGMVGCSKELDTMEYFNSKGEKIIENNKESDYKTIDEWETFSMVDWEDKKVKVSGKTKDISLDDKTLEMWLEVEKNNTPYPLKVIIPSNMVNIKFGENETVTVYGRFGGFLEKTYKDKTSTCWYISGYFLEKGDTTKEAAKEEKISNNNQLTQTSKKSTSTLSNESDNNSNTNQSVNSSNKTTSNTKKHSNNTNNSNSNTNNNSTCDFCGSSTNTVQTYGNYRLCHSCYQGVVNSAEGDHKLYEEDDDNYYQSDQDYEEDVEYYEDGGVKDGTALGEHPWNQDDYDEEDDD